MNVGNRVIVGATRDFSKPYSAPLIPELGTVLEIEKVYDPEAGVEVMKPVKVAMDSGATFWRPANYRDIGLRTEA